MAAVFLGQVWHGENEYAAGIVGCLVVVDVGPGAVLDLDPRHILLDLVAPDDDVL